MRVSGRVWRAFTQHRIRAGLAVLVVGIGSFGLGIAACAFHVCASATALIDSASQIRTTADAEREIASWKRNMGTDSWAESDDSGRGGNYYARIANRAIVRMHFVQPSEIIARVTIRNGELLSVSIFVNTPRAPVVIQEWFKTDTQNRFYLSYLKGTVPEARVQFAATLPDAQRRKGFAVRTMCLVQPGGCKKAEAVLPVIRELESGVGPG
jgi:hypothetical protein